MRCPYCLLDNPEGAKYCAACLAVLNVPSELARPSETLERKPPPAPAGPAAPAPAGAKAPAQPPAPAVKRVYILIVEDDESYASMLGDYLDSQGLRWRTECADAMQAVIQAEALKIGAVLMDIMLPGFGSGVDAYRMMRENPRLPKDLPILFITAMNPEKARKIVPANDPYVRLFFKPVDLKKLVSTLRELSGDRLLKKSG